MLTHNHRFHGHGSLRFVYKNGQAIRSPKITLKFIHNPRRSSGRFTVVVSKKIMKSAVRRNYIRRRIYEIIRGELPTLRSNYDVVIMVFSAEVFTMDYQSLTNLIKQLFSQANLYK